MVINYTYLFYIPGFTYENKNYGYDYGFGSNESLSSAKLELGKLKCYYCNKFISLTGDNSKINFRISFEERGAWLYLDCCGDKHENVKYNSSFIVKFNTNTLLKDFVAYSKKVMLL